MSDHVSGAGRDITDDWHHLTVLYAEVQHLIVIDAHLLSDTKLRSVLQLAVTTNTTLWLLLHTQHYTQDQHAELTSWPTSRMPARRFLRRFTDLHPPTDDTADPCGVRVPRSDFPTFRADCHTMLNADEFTAVDRQYVDAWQAAAAWIDEREDTDEDELADWLRTQLDGCATVDEMQVTLRATQAAFFGAGWLLKVDLDGFLGANDRVHTPAARSPQTWRRLRVSRQSHRRTACVLAAAGLSLDQMHQLHVGDVADDGSHITVDGRQVTIEEPAQPLLRQHVLHQQTLGHDDDGLLLTRISNGKPLSDHQLKRAITDPLLEAGVALINGQVVRRTPDPRRWTRRRGISITQL